MWTPSGLISEYLSRYAEQPTSYRVSRSSADSSDLGMFFLDPKISFPGSEKRFSLGLCACSRGVLAPILSYLILVLLPLIIRIHDLDNLVCRGIG